MTLTKDDISYLRRADDVYAINIDGQDFLRVVKRGDYRDKFSDDKVVDIAVEGNGKNGWFTSVWAFPWRSLKVGESVRLEWYPDASMNDYLRQTGLHADNLYVHITRGKQSFRYLAEVAICEDNSARMCRTI